jgi:phosphoadenosine phosphosulfate reductase
MVRGTRCGSSGRPNQNADENGCCLVSGRRRDQGADRAALPVFEAAPAVGGLVKVNPLAHWTFGDCFASLARHSAPQHPLHAQGYPSIGDVHSTLPVPKEKWFVYGGERSGRFQGLQNADGGAKTECGIHNRLGGGAPASSSLQPPAAAASSLLRPS